MPADGFFRFITLPWAYCANAAWAPPMSGSYPKPKPPLQSVMIATLTAFAFDDANDVETTAVPDHEHAERKQQLPVAQKRLMPVALLG